MDSYKPHLAEAIRLAQIAQSQNNHPCGSVIVDSGDNVVAASGNEVFTSPDITAHAEMLCIRKASKLLLDKNSDKKYTLFSSMEPCCGCSFFIARTNITKVVYACKDRYRTGISSLRSDPKFKDYFDKIEVVEEPFADLRDEVLTQFRDYFLKTGRPENAKLFELDS